MLPCRFVPGMHIETEDGSTVFVEGRVVTGGAKGRKKNKKTMEGQETEEGEDEGERKSIKDEKKLKKFMFS